MKKIQILSMVSLLLLFCGGCQQSGQDGAEQQMPEATSTKPDGTAQMVEILQNINPLEIPYYLNKQRAEHYKKLKDAETDLKKKLQYAATYADELLKAGETEAAIAELTDILNTIQTQKLNINPESLRGLLTTSAIAYMRLGEQQNCLLNHSAASCIIPIDGEGVHTLEDGSRKAIEIYHFLLEKNPRDLASVWLLNLAYMTLGEYPGKVPPKWRIPPEAFASDYDLPRFPDVAGSAGVDAIGLSGGCCVEDFNNDGFLDIIASSSGLWDQLKFFVNNGDGTFTDKTETAGLKGIVGGLNTIHADYNNDGFIDAFVLRGGWLGKQGKHPNSLLKNNGDGTFEDVTIEAGILSYHPTQTAAWGDFNQDGWVDLFIGNESLKNDRNPCELFLNNQDGTFTDVAPVIGLDKITGYIKGVVWGDVNNDGLPDLYISVMWGKNKLLLNRGGPDLQNWQFEDISRTAGVEEPFISFPAWFWDFNNDGWEDIFVSGYSSGREAQAYEVAADYLGKPTGRGTPRLYQNNGDGTFKEVSRQMNLFKPLYTMGCNFGDLDNDGFLDFYLATGDPDFRSIVPNRMFRNDRGNAFQDVTTAGGFGHIQKGHGVGFGDFDNDGDQDIYCVLGGAYQGDVFQNALYENPGNRNNWITIQFEGVESNRAAIGARIKITVQDGSNGKRHVYRTVSTGGSFGASSLQQEIGLGSASKIDEIAINWPNGKNQTDKFYNIRVNQNIKIIEGQKRVIPVEKDSFAFNKTRKSSHHLHDSGK